MEYNEITQLEKNFRDHNYSYFINTKLEFAHILYINLLGVFSDRLDKKVDIKTRLFEEIENESQYRSFVVFGDSGSGKTSLALYLCHEFWKTLEKCRNNKMADEEIRESKYIPIYISLRQIESFKDCKNLLTTFCDISPGQIKVADLHNWNLLLLLDGYDELEDKINLWEHNNWWLPHHSKKIKTVTFCKTVALKISDNEKRFTFGHKEQSNFIYVQALESDQIKSYIEKTVKFLRSVICVDDKDFKNDPWMMTKKLTNKYAVWETDTAEYEKWLIKTFPHLKKLANNPYLLTIILQILPGIVQECRESESLLDLSEHERAIRVRCSTEVGIYDEFVAQWFKYQAERNRLSKSNEDFFNISMAHQIEFMKAYAQNLAFTLVQKHKGFLGDGSITEADTNLWHLWKPIHNDDLLNLVEIDEHYSKLFPKTQEENDERQFDNISKTEFINDEIQRKKTRMRNFQALRNACFLSNPKIGSFKFFHSSLVEYFASRVVFENIRGRFNFYLNSDDSIYDNEFGINSSDLTDEAYRPLLKNLAQRAKTNEMFISLLFEIINKSSEILILSQMSANAMTILNFAGISLSGKNFRNAQIPRANLSGAITANSDFQFANLAGANLEQSWMVNCKFQGANFDGVKFGKIASLELHKDSVVGLLPYTNDGQNHFQITYTSGKIFKYSYSNGAICDIQSQTQREGLKYCCNIVGNKLLKHTFGHRDDETNLALYQFNTVKTNLVAEILDLNNIQHLQTIQIEHSTDSNDGSVSTRYLISTSLTDLETVENHNLDIFNCAPSTSAAPYLTEAESFFQRCNEMFYYYKIQLCTKGEMGLVILWGYIYKEMVELEYREPQIIYTFPFEANWETDKTLFKLYSDCQIYCFDVHKQNLVAIKSQRFILIYSIFPKTELIFQQHFKVDVANDDYEHIQFSSNGQYLIYKSDFVYVWINSNDGAFTDESTESLVKLLEVDLSNDITNFFVVFNNSCEMAAFSSCDAIFICKLPTGTIIQKIDTQDGLVFSLFPTFCFVDDNANSTLSCNLFSYVSSKFDKHSIETVEISDATEPTSHQQVKEIGAFCVSNDNSRVATSFTISENYEQFQPDWIDSDTVTKRNIISVFKTPISSQSLEFQKHIQSPIYKMLFTKNYLLVMVKSEILVLDINGIFFSSILFPREWDTHTYISSKYQKIVLDSQGALQLCSIVEKVVKDSSYAPISFQNDEQTLFNSNICVSRVTFDSKDGSHILLQDLWDTRYVLLWIPSKKRNIKIVLDNIPISSSLRVINNFYMIEAGCTKDRLKMCISNTFGCYSVKVSSDDSLLLQKPKHLEHIGFVVMSRFFLNVDWYVYGNSDGHIIIYYFKNKVKLAEFLLPHSVNDFNFNFKYNSSGDILKGVDIIAWDSKDNISSLVIDDINLDVNRANNVQTKTIFKKWKLNWTLKSSLVLNFQNSIVAKTFSVNENTLKLFRELNVNMDIGQPWPERCAYFSLSELYMPITEADCKFAILNTKSNNNDARMPIRNNMWVVSAIAKNSSSGSTNTNTVRIEHVGILIEGIHNGRHFAMEADLTANKKKNYVRIKLVPVSKRERLDELKKNYVARQWMRSKSDVQTLIQSIQTDQIEGREYGLFRNNCATWCIEKLKEIGIKKDRKKWYRKLFVVDLPSDLFSIRDRIVKTRLPLNISKRSLI